MTAITGAFVFQIKTQQLMDLGKYRPVYFVTGKSQGLGRYKNRTTGVSSTAGKFSSAFAFGSRIFESYDPGFCTKACSKSC